VEFGSLLEPLQSYAREIATSHDEISPARQEVLREVAVTIRRHLEADPHADLTFICTHNSRRSHLGQVWAQTAATVYELPAGRLRTFSGGTEVTACNIRTVRALRRAGLSIVEAEPNGGNPRYLVQYAEQEDPLLVFSKVYHQDGNPTSDYIALMCCSDADEKCPVVTGATERCALYYEDPKLADETPQEEAVYDQRCRQIAIEMFFMIACVQEQLG